MTTPDQQQAIAITSVNVAGVGQFKGTWWPKLDAIDSVDFFDWCSATVFENPVTKRLNMRVTKDGADYADFIGNFDGEWKYAPEKVPTPPVSPKEEQV